MADATFRDTFRDNFFKVLDTLARKYDFKVKNRHEFYARKRHEFYARFSRLNITIYADFRTYNIDISTEVGVSGGDYNERLYPKLWKSPGVFISNINNIYYKDCKFERMIRLYNYNRSCRYFHVEPLLPTLQNYLQIFYLNGIPITRSGLSAERCIQDLSTLKAYNNSFPPRLLTPKQALSEWHFEKYHWLEYLRISEDVDGSPLAEDDINSMLKILESKIDKHLKGMEYINRIEPA